MFSSSTVFSVSTGKEPNYNASTLTVKVSNNEEPMPKLIVYSSNMNFNGILVTS